MSHNPFHLASTRAVGLQYNLLTLREKLCMLGNAKLLEFYFGLRIGQDGKFYRKVLFTFYKNNIICGIKITEFNILEHSMEKELYKSLILGNFVGMNFHIFWPKT